MKAYERLLNYVKVFTTSDDDSDTVPSSARQFDLAHKGRPVNLIVILQAADPVILRQRRFQRLFKAFVRRVTDAQHVDAVFLSGFGPRNW